MDAAVKVQTRIARGLLRRNGDWEGRRDLENPVAEGVVKVPGGVAEGDHC
jgi:hypothetical protein